MLNKLTKELDAAVQQIGGIDAATEACDRMYSATFRGEAVKLGEWDDWEEESYNLKLELATALFSHATGEQVPIRHEVSCGCEYDCDCSLDSWGYAMEAFEDSALYWLEKECPEFEITKDTLVVCHLNYKGEGERGLYLYELNKQLPIFKSKNESFYQVN